MKIIPLAFDSMGTRSMATYVETKDVKLIIDPAVALAPKRFGLPPHPKEVERLGEHWTEIKKKAANCDILVVTHYHYDHHDPDEGGIYKDKTAMLKDPTHHINKSQTGRSKVFLENLDSLLGRPKEVLYTDGKEFRYGDTSLRFSPPMTHGFDGRLGYVTEVVVDDGVSRFLHSSDVLGPCTKEQTDYIVTENPETAFIDGPMYFSVREAINNLKRIIDETDIKTLVVDHHLLRDPRWREKIAEVFAEAEKKGGVRVLTAAGFLGRGDDLLESKRKELWKLYPDTEK